MLTMLGNPRRCCDGLTRRETLKAGALSALGGFGLADYLQAAQTGHAKPGKAKSVILLYMTGGASQYDSDHGDATRGGSGGTGGRGGVGGHGGGGAGGSVFGLVKNSGTAWNPVSGTSFMLGTPGAPGTSAGTAGPTGAASLQLTF